MIKDRWRLHDSVQLLSRVRLFATPWTTGRQASLSITNYWSLPKPLSIESVLPSNHLILCCPLFFLPSIFPSIRGFSNESAPRIRWPKYWSFSISPSNEYYFFALIAEEGFLISSCYSLELCIQMFIYFLFSFAFTSLFIAICKASSDSHFAFLHFFFWGREKKGLPFPSPVGHILSELSTMTHPS